MIKPKQIQGLIEMVNGGWKVVEGEFTLIEGGHVQINQINLGNIIDSVFPSILGEGYPDRYITCEMELFFASNHRYVRDEEDENYLINQWSVTANKLVRFNVLKPYAHNANGYYWACSNGDIATLSETGVYVVYDTANGAHHTIDYVGKLAGGTFEVVFNLASTSLYLTINSYLRSHEHFSAIPVYEIRCGYKLRMMNFEIENFSQEEYRE